MNLPRTWWVWGALSICAATLLAAMTWQTRNALAAERDRTAAEARADLQEKMRLSLWRMDSAGAAILAEEINSDPAAPVRVRFHWLANGRVGLQNGSSAPPELQQALQYDETSCVQVLRKLEGDNGTTWNIPPTPVMTEPVPPQQRGSAEAQKTASAKELMKLMAAAHGVAELSGVRRDEVHAVLCLTGEHPEDSWVRGVSVCGIVNLADTLVFKRDRLERDEVETAALAVGRAMRGGGKHRR